MPGTRATIFANGSLPDVEAARSLLRPGDVLIAADGGLRHLLALGLSPAILVGDLDSAPEGERRRLERAGARVIQHPRDKDETDLELALRLAVEDGHAAILVVGAFGGRLDQTLANLSLLSDPALAGRDVRLDDGIEEAFFIRRAGRVLGGPGEIVSLLPWGVPVEGVATAGLRWPLKGETLLPDRTRGVSNELSGETATISIESGLLLVVHRRRLAEGG